MCVFSLNVLKNLEFNEVIFLRMLLQFHHWVFWKRNIHPEQVCPLSKKGRSELCGLLRDTLGSSKPLDPDRSHLK